MATCKNLNPFNTLDSILESISVSGNVDVYIFQTGSYEIVTSACRIENITNKDSKSLLKIRDSLQNLLVNATSETIQECNIGFSYYIKDIDLEEHAKYIVVIGGIVNDNKQKSLIINNLDKFYIALDEINTLTDFLTPVSFDTFECQAKSFYNIIESTINLEVEKTQLYTNKKVIEKQNNLLLSAIEQSPVGIAIAEADSNNITFVNQSAANLTKCPESAFSGIDTDENAKENMDIYYLNGSKYEIEKLPLISALKSGKPSRQKEFFVINHENKKIWLRCNAWPVKDEEDKIIAAISFVENITNKKTNEYNIAKIKIDPEIPEISKEELYINKDFNLLDLIEIETLQEIQDSYAFANNVASLITDLDGKPITRPSNFCNVCSLVRQTEKGGKQCSLSDKFLGEQALKKMTPHYQDCHSCGFLDAAAPIIVGNKPIAFWLMGQSNLGKVDIDRIRDYAKDIGANEKEMVKAYSQMSNMSLEQFQYSMDLLWKLAQELSNKGYQNLQMQRELSLRKKREIELNDIKTKFQAISDNALDAICMLNEDNKVAYWNVSAEKMFNYKRSEVFSKNILSKIIIDKDYSNFLNELELYKSTGKSNYLNKTVEITCKNKGQNIFPAEISISIIKINEKYHSIAIIRDATIRKSLEQELLKEKNNLEHAIKIRTQELHESLEKLKKAQEHRDHFFSAMSHELRTPLNAILGFSDILDKCLFGELTEKQQEYINLIQYSGDLLLSLINDLLDITRIDAGRMTLELTKFEVEECIDSIIAFMTTSIKDKKLHINKQLDPTLSTIKADKRKFKQVIINLLSNAIKYSPEGSKITISLENNCDNTKIIITDTGYGINESDLPKIFNDFYQSPNAKDLAKGGVGIGLALCKRLIQLHEGTINVESKKNKGSSFSFTIPKSL